MSEPTPTLTLAALYAGQGLEGRAREIYRRLSQEGPPEQRDEAARRLARMGPDAGAAIRLLEGLLGSKGSAEVAMMSFRDELAGICSRVTGISSISERLRSRNSASLPAAAPHR